MLSPSSVETDNSIPGFNQWCDKAQLYLEVCSKALRLMVRIFALWHKYGFIRCPSDVAELLFDVHQTMAKQCWNIDPTFVTRPSQHYFEHLFTDKPTALAQSMLRSDMIYQV